MEDKLRRIFAETLEVSEDIIVPTLEYASIPEWDSVAHMAIIAEMEDEFDIMIDTEDVIDMSTFQIAIDTVKKILDE
tara:strand:- start:97 stop:327 length:231 start_codon:yes stop_codon:yes gene_type:complete